MKKTLKYLWVLLPIFTLASCYDDPEELEQAEEQLVAITRYDTSLGDADYKAYSTFAINDSIVVLEGNNTYSKISDQSSDNIVDEVVKQMTARGYTRVTSSDSDTSLMVTLYAFQITNIDVYNYPGWWYDYYDYWGWTPYYYYYPYTFVTSYSVGTLGIEIADLNKTNSDGTAHPVIWLGTVRGVMNYAHTQAEVRSTINDCFSQVPHNVLRRN